MYYLFCVMIAITPGFNFISNQSSFGFLMAYRRSREDEVNRYKLLANKARFQRPPQKNSNVQYPKKDADKPVKNVKDIGDQGYPNSYIHAAKRGTQAVTVEEESTPILDESCLNQNDFSTCLMGKVKEFNSLTNLKSEELKDKFKENVSIRSWFSHIQQASSFFRNEERVTWLDIEGVPLKFYTKETFNKIASKWGDLLHVDDENETCFHSKRICIKTKLGENIFESFESVFKGKVFWVRAKEVSGWILDFVEEEDDDTDSENEIRKEDLQAKNDDHMNYEDDAADSKVEVVSETIFKKDQS
nr:RNA-directed DNA polymerase, eukaryota [Tanacetum cinerariifolium]